MSCMWCVYIKGPWYFRISWFCAALWERKSVHYHQSMCVCERELAVRSCFSPDSSWVTHVCDQHMSAICVCVQLSPVWWTLTTFDLCFVSLFVLQCSSALKSVVVFSFSPKSFRKTSIRWPERSSSEWDTNEWIQRMSYLTISALIAETLVPFASLCSHVYLW